MISIHNYAVDVEEVFEPILDKGPYKLNHVIIPQGKFFPKHPTDSNVTIIIIQGELTLQIEDDPAQIYKKGQVIEVKQGIQSSLGNGSQSLTEVFVIKS